MKALINSLKRTHWFKASVAFLTCLSFLAFLSCQKDELNQDSILNPDGMSSSALSKEGKFSYGKVKDVEGNVYKTVKLGKQWWMAENLAYLPAVSLPTEISNTDPYYYVYDYIGTNVADAKATDNYKKYSVLYNWHAAMNACPTGWHLPSYAEWQELAKFVSDEKGPYYGYWYSNNEAYYWPSVGAHLKSTSGWGINGTDDFGFSALPGGSFFLAPEIGTFEEATINGWWWSSTDDYTWTFPSAWVCYLQSGNPGTGIFRNLMARGLSVRCVKN